MAKKATARSKKTATKAAVKKKPAATAAPARAAKTVKAKARIERPSSQRATPGTGGTPNVAEVSGKGRYVYCIIRSDQTLNFGPIGLGEEPAPVYMIRCDDLSA